MEILDSPVQLHFKNGKIFPSNLVFIGYLIFGISLFIFTQNIYAGIFGILISLFLSFTSYGTQIDPIKKTIIDYTTYLGIIKIGKTYNFENYHHITVIPSKQSSTSYSRTNSSYTTTDYFFSICILKHNYRGKRELNKYEQKSQSTDIAKQLASTMGLVFFEYDPAVFRNRMR